MLEIKKVVSPVSFFDERPLELFRWVSERYVAPLSAVIARALPPRVASEEAAPSTGRVGAPRTSAAGTHRCSRHIEEARERSTRSAGGPARSSRAPLPTTSRRWPSTRWPRVWPAAAGRSSWSPEAVAVPATASALLDAFGDRRALFLGGGKRSRYRSWLEIARGPLRRRRRDAARGVRAGGRARAHLRGDGRAIPRTGRTGLRTTTAATSRSRGPRSREPSACSRPRALGGGGRARSARGGARRTTLAAGRGRAARARRDAPRGSSGPCATTRRGFVFSPLPGYGVAQVCRSCGEPAACASCGGLLRAADGVGHVRRLRGAGRCRSCGGTPLRRPARRRRATWRSGPAAPPRPGPAAPRRRTRPPARRTTRSWSAGRTTSATSARGISTSWRSSTSTSPIGAPGCGARTQPRDLDGGGRLGAAARDGRSCRRRHPGDPMRAGARAREPRSVPRGRGRRRHEAGFPVGAAVFRVTGTRDLEAELRPFEPLDPARLRPSEGRTVCLLALDPERVRGVRARLRELAAERRRRPRRGRAAPVGAPRRETRT